MHVTFADAIISQIDVSHTYGRTLRRVLSKLSLNHYYQRYMNKEAIRQEIEKIQQGIIDDLEQSRERLETAADIDENEPIDPEDFSRQNELGNMATRLKFMLQKANHDLEHLQRIPLETGPEISEGSLVITDSYVFYVGIAVHPFDIDGKHVVSISPEAPIYVAMRGKKEGDSFALAGKTYLIDKVE